LTESGQAQQLREVVWGLRYDELGRFWVEWERVHGMKGVRQLCLADRYYLLVVVCRRIDALHPWIYARCREVEASPDDYLDLWARFHYKSTVITFAGAIQEIITDPDVTAAIFSHTRPDALKPHRQIKIELESNEILKASFPDILWANPQKDAPRWSDDGLIVKRKSNPKEATLEAHGLVEGMPTGSHFRLRIYDDVVTEKAVTTPDQVAKATRAWELSDNLKTPNGRKWHIGTRYSFADTYQDILERGALKPRIYAATADGRPDGKLVLLTEAQWAETKINQGPATIACQMLQNPVAGQQAMFDPMDLRQYEIRPATLNVYITVDPARSMKKGSANTAIAVQGIDAARNKYLLDGCNHRMDLKTRWEMVRDIRTSWINQPGVQAVHVGYEAYGAQADLDYFLERMEVEKNSFPIEELKWPRDGEASKDDRVQRLGPDFRAHRYYLPALMSKAGVASWWKLEPGSAGGLELKLTPQDGLSSLQRKMALEQTPYRIAKPIVRKDSEGNMYDLTRHFVEQQMLYPFAPLKDLVDAASRIYDMDPRPPVIIEDKELLPETFTDGI
jgi:hypothetical protein